MAFDSGSAANVSSKSRQERAQAAGRPAEPRLAATRASIQRCSPQCSEAQAADDGRIQAGGGGCSWRRRRWRRWSWSSWTWRSVSTLEIYGETGRTKAETANLMTRHYTFTAARHLERHFLRQLCFGNGRSAQGDAWRKDDCVADATRNVLFPARWGSNTAGQHTTPGRTYA
ncbi:hypothetical protein M433DRAFT_380025 [Acidomyces richmondensis BFW]|nr:hypothetical protein M433DRAFT_380025 [Acidomyces richmondensis BFW]